MKTYPPGVGGIARRLLIALVAACVVLVGPLGPQPSRAADTTADSLLLDGVGDSIGLDLRTDLTDANATFQFLIDSTAGQATALVDGADHDWRLLFRAAQGSALTVGHYANAGVQTPLTPELRITRDSSGCNQYTGSFTIHEIEYSGGQPIAMAVSFEQWCDGSPSPLVGLLRVNSDTPMAVLSTPAAERAYGNVTIGEVTPARSYTLEGLGELAVVVTSAALTGPAASDFILSANGCNGVVLDAGETCSFKIAFAPSVAGARVASLVIGNTAPQGARVLPVHGFGRIPTAVGVAVLPEWTYNPPGLMIVATVSPDPDNEEVECILDGEVIDGGLELGGDRLVCWAPRTVGTHTVRARYLGSNTLGTSISPTLTFVASSATSTNLTASRSSVGAGAPVTFTATVSTASNLLYPGGAVVIKDLTTGQVLGTKAITFGAATLTVIAGFVAGSHEIQATYAGVQDVLQGSSDSVALSVIPDTIAPTATAPTNAFITGAVMDAAGRLPIRLSWSGADNLSGIARYELSRQIDGGVWGSPGSINGSSATATLPSGHAYRYRVRAVDFAGNRSPWMYGSTFRLRRYEELAGAATYSTSWSKVGGGPYWGGTAMKSSTSGGRARFTFTGRSFGWLTLKSPTRGKAAIYVDGAYQTTVDLASSTTKPWVIGWSRTWGSTATRTVEIRVVGTLGRPRIDVDGYWVGR